MTRQKIAVSVGVPVISLVLLGGGFWLGKGGLSDKKLDNLQSASTSQSGASNNTIPLNQQTESVEGNNGLSVSNSGAMDLGQLGAGGSASGTGSGSSSSSGGSNTSSGLNPATFKDYEKYKDQSHALFGEITKGTGAELAINKRAAIYYRGWLTNGQMFDQTRLNASGSKEPLIFTLGSHEVVPGMEEGVLGMKVGGKRLIIIPPAVGYGEKGQGPVPANSVMVFEVELVTVQ